MFVIMLISMLVYMSCPRPRFAAKLAERIAFLPLIIGLSYELIRFRGQTPRFVPRAAHGARDSGRSASPPSLRPTSRPRSPSALSMAPWRSKPSRAANS
jgi:hypothetical protein